MAATIPKGHSFFQKGARAWSPDWVEPIFVFRLPKVSSLPGALFSIRCSKTRSITCPPPLPSPFEKNSVTYQEASTNKIQICAIKPGAQDAKSAQIQEVLLLKVRGHRESSPAGRVGTSTCPLTSLRVIGGRVWIPLPTP